MARPATTRNLGRLSEIAQVAVKHGFGYFFERHRLTDILPWGTKTDGVAGVSPGNRGQHLREMFEELGPTFVKFGQLLSTRPDVVPPDIIVELQKLQDEVRPFPGADVERVVQEELGLTIERAFLEFEEQPVAAASIGQVHRAILPNGDHVAVKVQRPNAPRQIESDIALLHQAARLAHERVRALDFIDARQLVDEFARSIRQELDYLLEARNAEAFRRDFDGHQSVRIPKVYWSYTRSRILTLELLEGVQLADLNRQAHTPPELERLARLITETWMAMIFRNGHFHGDPHPANVFVLDDETIGLVDFGQAGKLSDDDMSKLTRLFIDAANENVDVLPRRLVELGVRYPKEREDEFVAELRELYTRYYGASLSEIDPLQVIRDGFDLIFRLNLRLPARFVLLDKAIATLGSVTVDLYPDFNVFEVARPYARSLMLERFTPQRMLRRAQRDSRELAHVARTMPTQLYGLVDELRSGQIEVGFVHKGLGELRHTLDVAINRLVVAMVVAGGLIGSSLIGILAKSGPQILGIHVISFVGFILSGILGLWLLWAVIRSGRL